MYGALFCRPGTRIGELADDDTSEHEWCAEMFRALDMSLLLFPCATGAAAGLTGATGMAADLDRLDDYLAALESDPAPGAAPTHTRGEAS
jgi:hypothetical protein